MPPPISLVSALACAVLVLLPAVCYAPPQFDRPQPEATLNADGSVVVRTGESIRLEYETRNGQIVRLKTVPLNTYMKLNMMHIELQQDGSKPTKFGEVTPRCDVLYIHFPLEEKTLHVRCAYTPLSSPRSEFRRFQGNKGYLSRAFRSGVTQVILSEFQLK